MFHAWLPIGSYRGHEKSIDSIVSNNETDKPHQLCVGAGRGQQMRLPVLTRPDQVRPTWVLADIGALVVPLCLQWRSKTCSQERRGTKVLAQPASCWGLSSPSMSVRKRLISLPSELHRKRRHRYYHWLSAGRSVSTCSRQ